MKVLITGASGFYGWEIVRQMKLCGGFEIVAASANPAKLKDDANYQGVTLISNDMLWNDEALMQSVNVIIHAGFCRESIGEQLMQSLIFSKKLFEQAVKCGVDGIVNISSQSVYGSDKDDLPDESGKYAPTYLYALAKSASELLLESVVGEGNTKTFFTNIRLASLVGLSKNVPVNVIYKFVERAMENQDLNIQGGQQNFSFIDVRDAAEAIIKLLFVPASKWENAYNLGPEKQTNIVDLARSVCEYAKSVGKTSKYIIKEEEIYLNTGMSSELLYNTINWRPRLSIDDIVKSTAEYITGR